MEGGPKSLNAGRKVEDDGREGEGTLEPGKMGKRERKEKKLVMSPIPTTLSNSEDLLRFHIHHTRCTTVH